MKAKIPSPHTILGKVSGAYAGMLLRDALELALKEQFERARVNKIKAGIQFDLTLPEFMALVSSSRRQKIMQKLNTGNFPEFMKSNYGYVLTWKSRAALATGIFDKETACYVNRIDSRRNQHFAKGDKHEPETIEHLREINLGKVVSDVTKERMSEAHKGSECTDETKAKISATLKGKPKSPEQVAKMKAAATERWAKKRALEEYHAAL